MRRLLRHRALLGGIVVIAALLFIALRPRPIEVELARVVRGAIRVTVDEEGITRIRDKFLITAPVTGTVSRIEIEAGDPVTRGQVVATMYPERAPLLDARTRAERTARVDATRAALEQARAEEKRSAAGLAHAESEARRVRPLNKAGAISDAELETYETQAQSAAAAHRATVQAVVQAASELEAARASLSEPAGGATAARGRSIELRAPADGVVLRRLRESESVAPAGEGLLEIGARNQLEIVADFLSTDAVQIPVGATVIIDHWGGDASLNGRVRRIEPSGFTKVSALGVEEQRVNVIVDFSDPAAAWKALGDGYRVEVRAVLWEGVGVLKVPVGTLFRHGEAWALFVVRDGRAERRTVTIGHRTDREAEVTAGVRGGESVVMHPNDALVEGARVAPTALFFFSVGLSAP
jgi:HlyD family secretion protein